MPDDLEKTLWATADKLRADMDAAEYKHLELRELAVQTHFFVAPWRRLCGQPHRSRC